MLGQSGTHDLKLHARRLLWGGNPEPRGVELSQSFSADGRSRRPATMSLAMSDTVASYEPWWAAGLYERG